MRKISAVLVCILIALQVQAQNLVNGTVLSESRMPLEGASIVFSSLNKGTIADVEGKFTLANLPNGSHEIIVSYIGYKEVRKEINLSGETKLGEIIMLPLPYLGEEATISALRAGEKTPMAYVNLNKDEIQQRNYGQDVPLILSTTPSIVSTSDAGHGIGYTAMRIRGTDANRINVTINGIPLNDAESHSVFWVDLPELAASADQIQIQRGVGTSTNGAAAFGASVNIQTSDYDAKPYAAYDVTAGSFNTLRNSISLGSGLIRDKIAVDMRISDLHSDGYVDRSWTDLQSYYLAAGYYGKSASLKFITFGGFEELYQSWGGVPSSILETDRRSNELGAYIDTAGNMAYYENQVDHYDQVHYQLHYSNKISAKWSLNAALHYTHGMGYYEQYETNQDYLSYGMINPVIGTDTITETDLVRQKWLDNDFYGAIASIKYKGANSDMIIGGGWNTYSGLHFGKVIWAENFGLNTIGHQWYEGIGVKTDWNIYGKYYQYINESFTTFIDLQLRSIKHDIEGMDANNRDVTQEHSFLFFNPKFGFNYVPFKGHRAFLSYSRANREPNRNNYTDAPLENPPLPETLNDFESGYSIQNNSYKAAVTIYYMDYNQQLVLTGQINEVGYPVMTNVEESFRAGAEIEWGINYFDKIRWTANITFSENRIQDFTNLIDNWDYWSDPENEPYQVEEYIGKSVLSFSPSIVSSSQFDYLPTKNFSFSLISKYVSKQYIDNSSDPDKVLNSYFINDLKASYSFDFSWAREFTFSILVRNLLDVKYETNAWLYRYYSGGIEAHLDGFYPQAGRHLMLSLNTRF